MWVRYVDNVFTIWPHGDHSLNEFLEHLNSQKPCTRPIYNGERECMRKRLPSFFFDVLVEKEGTWATTSIFRKETHTDRYMNYNSPHHARIKSGIIKCLKTRAETVCDTTRLSGELYL